MGRLEIQITTEGSLEKVCSANLGKIWAKSFKANILEL